MGRKLLIVRLLRPPAKVGRRRSLVRDTPLWSNLCDMNSLLNDRLNWLVHSLRYLLNHLP